MSNEVMDLKQRDQNAGYFCIIEKLSCGEYSATFPDFDGCVSGGATINDLIYNAKEALLLHISGMREDGDVVPEPSKISDVLLNGIDDLDVIFGIVLIHM